MSRVKRTARPVCVDGYVRVSRVGKRRGPSFISPTVQREAIEDWTARQGYRLLEVFEELDQSGARADRPLLEEAIRRVEVGASSALVVWRVDRFGRSLGDGVRTIERIRSVGGGFYSVQDGLDISTDAGRLVLRILLSVAEYQLDGVRAGWEAARERAIRRGQYTGTRVPVGYRLTRSGRLRPDPRIAPIITELFRRRAAGESLLRCSEFLEGEGVLTGKGNRGWSLSSLAKMMRSRHYLGEVYSGRYVKVGAHPPLTDRATWEAGQHPPNLRRHEQLHALLAGLVRCASCRHVMTPRTSRPQGGTPCVNYCCRARHASGHCAAPSCITASKLDPYVIEAALTILRNRRRRPAVKLAAASSRAEAAVGDLARYRDNDGVAKVVGQRRFLEGLAVRQERLREANLSLLELRTRAGIHDLPTIDEVRRVLSDASVLERRDLIAQIIDMVFVGPGHGSAAQRVTVCPAGNAPRLIARQGDRGRVNLPIQARRGWLNALLAAPSAK
jgi:DNA invertase Pin-like site-specific DNA recombinase